MTEIYILLVGETLEWQSNLQYVMVLAFFEIAHLDLKQTNK